MFLISACVLVVIIYSVITAWNKYNLSPFHPKYRELFAVQYNKHMLHTKTITLTLTLTLIFICFKTLIVVLVLDLKQCVPVPLYLGVRIRKVIFRVRVILKTFSSTMCLIYDAVFTCNRPANVLLWLGEIYLESSLHASLGGFSC